MKLPVVRRDVVIRHDSPKQIRVIRHNEVRPVIQRVVTKAMELQVPQRVPAVARPVRSVPAVRKPTADQMRAQRTGISEQNRKMLEVGLDQIKKLKNIGRGRLLIIVGNGPSIVEAPLEKFKNVECIDIMSINKPDSRLWPTRWWLFCDPSQVMRNQDRFSDHSVPIITSTAIKQKRPNQIVVKNRSGKGFSRNIEEGYHIGRSSCYASMQVAFYMNYDKIFMFGVDMNPDGIDGKLHFYGQNPDVQPKSRRERFKFEAESYRWAANNLPLEDRQKFVFCSSYNPWDFINFFGGKRDHKTVHEEILKTAAEKAEKSKTTAA